MHTHTLVQLTHTWLCLYPSKNTTFVSFYYTAAQPAELHLNLNMPHPNRNLTSILTLPPNLKGNVQFNSRADIH